MKYTLASSTMYYADTGGTGSWPVYIRHDIQPTVPKDHMIRCEYCKTKNKYDAPHCQSCGAPLPD